MFILNLQGCKLILFKQKKKRKKTKQKFIYLLFNIGYLFILLITILLDL